MEKILIIDDSEVSRAILCELFHSTYDILEAANGLEAMSILAMQRDEIDLLLLDIVMPVMDGFQVLQALNDQGLIPSLPVIMITAQDKEEVSLPCYQLGVADVIQKPFDPNLVKKRVDNIIELHRYRHDLEKTVRFQTRELQRQADLLQETSLFLLDALSTVVEFRTCNYDQHVKRVRGTTRLILESLAKSSSSYDLTASHIETICNISTIHDIGKIAVPDSILAKTETLSPAENEILKAHTLKGAEIIERLHLSREGRFYRYCYDICRFHHERWDGSGYPDGLKGDEIPIWAQAVSLADEYDSLVSGRAGMAPYLHQEAMSKMLSGECGQFNPILLDCFMSAEKRIQDLYAAQGEDAFTDPPPSKPPLEPDANLEELFPSDRLASLLKLEQQKHQLLTRSVGEILFDYDPASDCVVFSEQFKDLFGFDFQQSGLMNLLQVSPLLHEEDRLHARSQLDRCMQAKTNVRFNIRLKDKTGNYNWYEVTAKSLWDPERAQCRSVIGKLIDINDLKKESERWRTLAQQDSLTGLLNRTTFQARARDWLAGASRNPAAMLFIDVDNFKMVNDRFGHMFGDKALLWLAHQLTGCFRRTDLVGRIGGDEFVVLAKGLAKENLKEKLDQLLSKLSVPFEAMEVSAHLTVSIGIAMYPADGLTYEALMEKSDRTLYIAKNNGKGLYTFYDTALPEGPFRSVITPKDS